MFSRKDLINLIWPLIIEQLLAVLVGMIDVLMVARLGETAVSGVSLFDSIAHLVIMLLSALTAGGTVVCAQFIGAKDFRRASKGAGQQMLTAVLLMAAVSAVLLIGGRGILSLLFGSVENAVMSDAVKYMYYTSVSFPFLGAYYAASSVFKASGNTRLPMLISLGMNILNILGNAFCIFILHMGVEGVAIPTLLARAAAAVAIVFLMQRKDRTVRIRSASDLRPDKEILQRILSIGIPSGIESSLFNIGKLMLQSLVSTLGTPSIAAYAVASNLVTYLYLPGNAVNAAITTVAAQCFGADEPKQAKNYTKLLILANYALLVPICAIAIAGRHLLVGLYNLSGESAPLAAGLLLAHAAAMILWPVAFDLPYYFRAKGMARFTMVVALIAMVFLRIGLAFFFIKVLHKNVIWIWYAMFADWIFRIIVYGRRFLSEKMNREIN